MTDIQIISKLLINQSRVSNGMCSYGMKITNDNILQFNKEATKVLSTNIEFRQVHINQFVEMYTGVDLVLEDLDEYNNPIVSIKKEEKKKENNFGLSNEQLSNK